MSYNPDDDFVNCWFVVFDDPKHKINEVVAWSKDKQLVKFYLEFHGTKKLKAKKLSDYQKNIAEMCNAHINEEIQIAHLITKVDNKMIAVMAPVTQLDLTQIHDFSGSFCETDINYATLHVFMSIFKNRYQKALNTILLNEVIEAVIFPKSNLRITSVHLDELVLLHRLIVDLF